MDGYHYETLRNRTEDDLIKFYEISYKKNYIHKQRYGRFQIKACTKLETVSQQLKNIYCLIKTAHTCLPLNTVGLDCFLIAVIVSLSPFFHSQILLSLMIKSKFNTLRMVIVGK